MAAQLEWDSYTYILYITVREGEIKLASFLTDFRLNSRSLFKFQFETVLQPWPCSIYIEALCAMCLASVVAIAQHNRHTGKLIALSRERQWNEYKEWKRRWVEWEGDVAYKNRACQQTEVPYERYILMPACLRVCVSASRLIYGPSCWPALCIFPQEREGETGRDGKWGRQRERGHCQAFCHVVYFVYKRVPLTYFVPHNERSWWPLINYITHKSALHTHTNTQTHTHTPPCTLAHTLK